MNNVPISVMGIGLVTLMQYGAAIYCYQNHSTLKAWKLYVAMALSGFSAFGVFDPLYNTIPQVTMLVSLTFTIYVAINHYLKNLLAIILILFVLLIAMNMFRYIHYERVLSIAYSIYD